MVPNVPVGMKPKDAILLLDRATATIACNRAEHFKILEAIKAIHDFIEVEQKKESEALKEKIKEKATPIKEDQNAAVNSKGATSNNRSKRSAK